MLYLFSFIRYIKFLFILISCAACGFKPLYHTALEQGVLNDIVYERISDDIKNARVTFFLNNEIEKMLHTEKVRSFKYILKITYNIDISDYLVQDSSVANRKKIQATMGYTVTELESNKVIISGKLMDFDSFAVTESPYSDFLTEEDLVIKILLSLVQELRLHILSRLSSKSAV